MRMLLRGGSAFLFAAALSACAASPNGEPVNASAVRESVPVVAAAPPPRETTTAERRAPEAIVVATPSVDAADEADAVPEAPSPAPEAAVSAPEIAAPAADPVAAPSEPPAAPPVVASEEASEAAPAADVPPDVDVAAAPEPAAAPSTPAAFEPPPAEAAAVESAVAVQPRSEPSPLSATAATEETACGLASWYGEQDRGLSAANSDAFASDGLTAAHRSLPIGTRIAVRRDGREVEVVVTDRGPYDESRMLDLSWGAASRLGYAETQGGAAEVCYRVLSRP